MDPLSYAVASSVYAGDDATAGMDSWKQRASVTEMLPTPPVLQQSEAGPIRTPRRRLQPPKPLPGKYSGFVRKLQSAVTPDRERYLSVRSYQGEVYVCVRDRHPDKMFETVLDDKGRQILSRGMNLTQLQWHKLSSPLMLEWMERAIANATNDTNEGFNTLDSPDHSETVLTEDNERRFLIEKNKWITVKKFTENVFVTLREFYWSEYYKKVIPGRGITMNLFEWDMLCKYISEVDVQLESFNNGDN